LNHPILAGNDDRGYAASTAWLEGPRTTATPCRAKGRIDLAVLTLSRMYK
jgi:hypothetical protein